jgi:arabinan endo-1,5-alpha-L-arabinosidase
MLMRKRTSFLYTIAAAVVFLTGCGGGGGKSIAPPVDTTTTPTGYLNPVLDTDFPDPAVIKVGGTYWAYATQTFLANGLRINIQSASSPDLVHWTYGADVLPTKPAWSTVTWNFWAPHVTFAAEQNKYIMYYSADADTSDMCIGIATATVPQGPFTDIGHPLVCGPGFSHIDPMAFDDPTSGKHYLYWGSASAPIVVRELAADRISFAAGSSEIPVLQTSGAPYEGLIEGAWVVKRPDFYYLYYSGNDCCSLPNPHYAVLVARGPSPTGPFQKMADALGTGSSVIVAGSDALRGPGHNAVITDGAGADWLVYHAVDATKLTLSDGHSARRPMVIDRIVYQANGWPSVANGQPSHTRTTLPTP